MKPSEEKHDGVVRLELKVCECCAVLWLRPAGKAWRYCRRCVRPVSEMAKAPLKQPVGTTRGWRKRRDVETVHY